MVVRSALALALLTSAALKLRSPGPSRSALGTFGVPASMRPASWTTLIVVEAALGISVAAGSSEAAYAAAALCTAFALLLVLAILGGQAGAPCGCFGARSRVTWAGVARSAALAGAFAALPATPETWPSAEGWLVLGLGLTFGLVLLLGIAVVALAREVGLLRLRLADSALEIPDEGPQIGERLELIERFDPGGRTRFALAVFSSEGCHLCRALEPVISAFRQDPLLSVEVFDEVQDAEIWRELEIPGSPFAVALGRDGAVRAKGTFNSYGQLESILAAAEQRLAEARA